MGSQQTPAVTTQVQKTELPAWVDQGGQENYALAKQVADRPFQQYTGDRVAGLSALEQQAPTTLQAGADNASQLYNNAGGALTYYASGQFNPGTVNAPTSMLNVANKTFNGNDLAGYMNPYTNDVVNTTLQGMDRATNTAMQQNSDANRASGSWGGSRDAISNAVLQSEGIRNKAATEAGLRSSAYTDSANRLMQDNSANLTAQQSNQSALQALQGMGLQAQTTNAANKLAGANLGLQAAQGLGTLGNSVNTAAAQNALLQSQLGANARGVQQAGYDDAKSQFDAAYNAPLDQLNTRLAALGMTPYGKTTTGTSTSTGGTSSNTGMQVAGGLMSILPLMFSDERLKKNVETIGTTDAGVPLKSYEYKGFMGRKMPGRHVGVMAQELERVDPGAVHRVKAEDGKTYRAVDYSRVGRGFMGRAA